MENEKVVFTWRGVPSNELSRATLLKIIEHSIKQNEETRKIHKKILAISGTKSGYTPVGGEEMVPPGDE